MTLPDAPPKRWIVYFTAHGGGGGIIVDAENEEAARNEAMRNFPNIAVVRIGPAGETFVFGGSGGRR